MQKDCLKRETFSKRMYYTERECYDTERNKTKQKKKIKKIKRRKEKTPAILPRSRLDKGHRSRPFLWKHWLMRGPVTCCNHCFIQSERFPIFLICLRDSKGEKTVSFCIPFRALDTKGAGCCTNANWTIPWKSSPWSSHHPFILMRRGIYTVP